MDSQTGANIAFRLLRLTAPTLQAELPKLSDDPADACGFRPVLQLPNSSDVLLGETFTCYVRLINLSDAALYNIVIKCELQTSRHRLMLSDSSAKPLAQLAAQEHLDFLLQHDVKEPNDHVLTCSATFALGDGGLRSEQQALVFTATNPLSVRTKTRSVAGATWLEVCVENVGTSPIYLDHVRLDAAAGASAEQLASSPKLRSSGVTAADILQRRIDALQVLGTGSAHNLLYRVQTPPASAGKTVDAKTDLGKLEIKWRRSMGEVGRLQTQHIMLSGAAAPPVELRLVDVPPTVVLERPFNIVLALHNNLDRRLGPLQISFAETTSSGSPGSPPFQVLGVQEAAIEDLGAHSSIRLPLTLLPSVSGICNLSGISVLEAVGGGGKPVASLEPTSIFVQTLEP